MENENKKIKSEEIRETVRGAYGKIAAGQGCGCGPSSCCGSAGPEAVARGVGYSEEELRSLPDGANMGLSCGNPNALASLKPGEVVLDLGAGGGFDVFIAAKAVGLKGRVIGVDMTPEMVSMARRNAARFKQATGLDNMEFRLGEIEHLPVADASVDVVISNCVINLSPDKAQVWREVARVLRSGGRVAVSDMALRRALPEAVKESVTALVGCVAGAVLIEETEAMIKAAGFVDLALETKDSNIEAMTDWKDPQYRTLIEHIPPGVKMSDYVTSLNISARKS